MSKKKVIGCVVVSATIATAITAKMMKNKAKKSTYKVDVIEPIIQRKMGVYEKYVKRVIDIICATGAIVVFSPLYLGVSLLVRVKLGSPVLFTQDRPGLVGPDGKETVFKMYKFRSMTVQDPGKEKSRWTTKGDARVTLIGKIIRRTSIDEVPQFFNILIGDMSLVGPRPERPFFVEKFKEEIPRYMIKHQVRPGLTGWAQVNGYRGDTSIIKRIEHDLYYIENWTLGLDFKIMFLTVFKGFINKNAY